MRTYPMIMVATDFSPLSVIAQQTALEIAKTAGTKRVHFEHIVELAGKASVSYSPFADPRVEQILEYSLSEGRRLLDEISVSLEGVEVTRHVTAGIVGRELARAANQLGASLVVVASHGYGALKRSFLGSAANGLVRAAHCPVLVVGEERRLAQPVRKVLAAIDMSPVSKRILEESFRLVTPGGQVDVFSMYELSLVPPDALGVPARYPTYDHIREASAVYAKRVQALVDSVPHPGIVVQVQAMLKASPAQVILDVANETHPDLLVVGTSGNSAWHRLVLGSTATRVLNEAKAPVLVIPFDAEG